MRYMMFLIVFGFAAYGGYTFWSNHHTAANPAPVAANESASPTPQETVKQPTKPALLTPEPPTQEPKTEPQPPAAPDTSSTPKKRLAPDGVYYVVQAVSVVTEDGVRGIRVGTQVKLIKDSGTSLRVTDGQQEFEVARAVVTNDLDVASASHASQAAQQAAQKESNAQQMQAVASAEARKQSDAQTSTDDARKKIAMQNLQARSDYLTQESANIESRIRAYQTAASNLRTKQIFVDQRIAGDTHTNEIIALNQKLGAIRLEQKSVAAKMSALQP